MDYFLIIYEVFCEGFQSPFHRGKECNRAIENVLPEVEDPFSPLFIGVRNVTVVEYDDAGVF